MRKNQCRALFCCNGKRRTVFELAEIENSGFPTPFDVVEVNQKSQPASLDVRTPKIAIVVRGERLPHVVLVVAQSFIESRCPPPNNGLRYRGFGPLPEARREREVVHHHPRVVPHAFDDNFANRGIGKSDRLCDGDPFLALRVAEEILDGKNRFRKVPCVHVIESS